MRTEARRWSTDDHDPRIYGDAEEEDDGLPVGVTEWAKVLQARYSAYMNLRAIEVLRLYSLLT